MFKLGQLNLELTLMSAGSTGKDLKDQSGPAQHAFLKRRLQVTFLGRRQVIAKNDEFAGVIRQPGFDFIHLTTSDESTGMWKASTAGNTAHRLESGGANEFGQLFRRGKLGVVLLDMNQQRAAAGFRSIKEQ